MNRIPLFFLLLCACGGITPHTDLTGCDDTGDCIGTATGAPTTSTGTGTATGAGTGTGTATGTGTGTNAEICDDTIDNDGDNQVDCDDADCDSFCDNDNDGALSMQAGGDDCDDNDGDRYPSAVDICGDGIDQDCSGTDAPCSAATCNDHLLANPGSLDGVYPVEPLLGGPLYDVYCDMTTDGGGWTLVASTAQTTMDDAALAYHVDLQTLTPASAHNGIWHGLRDAIPGTSDIRFTCKTLIGDSTMAVDLSFYNTRWYREITTGTDLDSCFNENTGIGQDPAPQRRNNVSGATLPALDQWNYGYLEGEDSCSDAGDFTIDFDDRGMDSNQSDGTDWGEDDSVTKCGTSPGGQAWFIFVR